MRVPIHRLTLPANSSSATIVPNTAAVLGEDGSRPTMRLLIPVTSGPFSASALRLGSTSTARLALTGTPSLSST